MLRLGRGRVAAGDGRKECNMTLAENKDIIRRYSDDLWGAGRLDLVEQLFAPDFVEHDPDPVPERPAGREGIKHDVLRIRKAFPDFAMNTDDIICEGDRVALHWSARGTQTGDLIGIPATGRQVTMSGMQFFRIREGRIVERWGVFDRIGVMRQLGVA